MINALKRYADLAAKNDFKQVITNFFYLLLLNITNFVLPLLTFPYLVSRLGVEKFGLLAFATSIISYFLIVADYGFNLTATRQISLHRVDRNKINEIVSSVFLIKFCLVAASSVVITVLVLLIPKFNKDSAVYIFTFGTVIGQSLFPVWYFQGIEKMRFISILNIVSKLIFTACVFLFVHNGRDYLLVPIFNSLGYIVIGVLSILVILGTYKVRFIRVDKQTVLFYLKDGWHLFVSNISVTLYTTAVTTILGFFSSNMVVGYYSIADKIIQIVRGMIAPVSQALFPYLVKEGQKDKSKVLRINRQLLRFGSFGMLPLCIVFFFFAPQILHLVFKTAAVETIQVLRIFAIIPFLIFLATVFALFTMLVFDKNKEYSKIIISAGLINIVLALIFIPLYKHIGAAFCVLFIEVYVTVRYILYTQKNNLTLL